jgi:hypothetical protein
VIENLYLGESPVRRPAAAPNGGFVEREGEQYYRITDYDRMPPFLVSLTSGSDHWMYLSSNGGLTCGRICPEYALFPYTTDDKVHDASSTTGPQTIFRVRKADRTWLWKPLHRETPAYRTTRSLFKNRPGNRMIFEEINHDLGLVFSYRWSSSDRFGFVRQATIENLGADPVNVEVLDGLRNLLPYGIDPLSQNTLSTLLDGYKQAESVSDAPAAIFSLSSILTDRAEPSEALKATVAWCLGLDQPRILLSEDQVENFCLGAPVRAETFKCGKRGAFYVHGEVAIRARESRTWYLLADINQGPSKLNGLLGEIRNGVDAATVETDILAGQSNLRQLVGMADGFQYSADALVSGRHFSNTLFNIMRGGVFQDGYRIRVDDFLKFAGIWNRPLSFQCSDVLAGQAACMTLEELLDLFEREGNPDLLRLALEYLPLVFSRRHGDPSRPWNHFSIEIRNADGTAKLWYQGNWRDIFQNWEALAISYPRFIESFIVKFVNASTADGYNPYRISTDGIDWEVLDQDDPWSNIGYWGDHQVNYLVRLLEFSHHYHPGRIGEFLDREIFVYADVPYRLRNYAALVKDPRNSVEYDERHEQKIANRVRLKGSDGKLVTLADGAIYRVNLLEKLLASCLAKIGNLVPGGGIWMNTQRPEWNDANNALVGYGLSMVTLCYLRRFMKLFEELVSQAPVDEYHVSSELVQFFVGVDRLLKTHLTGTEPAREGRERKTFMDALGALGESYRQAIYAGFSGRKVLLSKLDLLSFFATVMTYLDQAIRLNRRVDGLYHSYNLIRFGDEAYSVEALDEMLEGQVAVLSSGFLDATQSLELLQALRASAIYREDQNSYMLYPNRKLPGFLEKNRIPESAVDRIGWLQSELENGNGEFVERDINGDVHFNGRFRNAHDLRGALERSESAGARDVEQVCDLFDDVFGHRQFTGRSGSMYKYEGLGCIYWHMVSKLLLATAEVIIRADEEGADKPVIEALKARFHEIREGIGLHKSPAEYGAFPMDPYSHTPGFAGVQQPGMTGQVKEDIIVRFSELGVKVRDGRATFQPLMLEREGFTGRPAAWRYSMGGGDSTEALEPGSMAFSLCGVPVIYRLAGSTGIRLLLNDGTELKTGGATLDAEWSRSLFRREGRIRKIEVCFPESEIPGNDGR